MNSTYLYLWLNIGVIIIPLLASFYSKANFSKTWHAAIPAIIIPAVFFIIWDIYFTELKIWGFNVKYITGITFFSLPIEELLFFITIPYACIFTYFSIRYLLPSNPLKHYENHISWSITLIASIGIIIYWDKMYTCPTLLLTILLLWLNKLYIIPKHLDSFYFTFIILLFPFLLVNGILTGSFIDQEIVWYDNNENSTFRIATIPVEDLFYAFLLLISNIGIYERLNYQCKFLPNNKQKSPSV